MRPFIERGRAAAGWLSWAVVGAASAILLLSPVLYAVARTDAPVSPEPVRVRAALPPVESAPPVRGCRVVGTPAQCPGPEEIVQKIGCRQWRIDAEKLSCRLRAERSGHHFGPIVPAFRDGVVVGFKVFPRPSGLGAALGFRSGDIIRSINGHGLADPDQALEAYEALGQLPADAPLTVVLERRGMVRTHTYQVLPSVAALVQAH